MSVRIVQNHRYPVAPDAWRGGIQPFEAVKGHLPRAAMMEHPAEGVVFEFMIGGGQSNGSVPPITETIRYRCRPCIRGPFGQTQVYYYVALNENNDPPTWDYAISPDKLDEFIRNAGHYYTQATTVQAPTVPSSSRRLPGARYPTSPNAWKRGIVLYPVARSQLPVKDVYVPPNEYHLWLEFEFMNIANKQFRVVPHVTGQPKPQVLYYIVQQRGARAPLYAVSPDKLDLFAENVGKFLFIAAASYPRSKHAVNASRVVDHAMRGDWGSAFSELGNAWVDALSDPEWWVLSFAIPTTGYIAARGASAVPRPLPPSVAAGIKGPSPSVITGGRHMSPGRLVGRVFTDRGVVYRVQEIRFTGAQTAAETEAVSVAREAHRQMIERSAQVAKSQGQRTFTLYGESAGPDFVKHANGLAQKVGVPGSGKAIPNPNAPFPDYQVTLDVAKVQATNPSVLLTALPGGLKGEEKGVD